MSALRTGLVTLGAALISACAAPLASEGDESTGLTIDGDDRADHFVRAYVWSGGEIKICFAPSAMHESLAWARAAFRGAAERTWARVSAVRFHGFAACSAADLGQSVRVEFADSRPHSCVGNDFVGNDHCRLTVNPYLVEWVPRGDASTDESGCVAHRRNCFERYAVHELGHAIGLLHEHDRDDTPRACRELVDNEETRRTSESIGPYDARSVMNYCDFGVSFAEPVELSAGDIAVARVLYGRKRLVLAGPFHSGAVIASEGRSVPSDGHAVVDIDRDEIDDLVYAGHGELAWSRGLGGDRFDAPLRFSSHRAQDKLLGARSWSRDHSFLLFGHAPGEISIAEVGRRGLTEVARISTPIRNANWSIARLNDDDFPDVVAFDGARTLWAMFGALRALRTPVQIALDPVPQATHPIVGDPNGDSLDDILFAEPWGVWVSVNRGGAFEGFDRWIERDGSLVFSATLADAQGDGRDDYIETGARGFIVRTALSQHFAATAWLPITPLANTGADARFMVGRFNRVPGDDVVVVLPGTDGR